MVASHVQSTVYLVAAHQLIRSPYSVQWSAMYRDKSRPFFCSHTLMTMSASLSTLLCLLLMSPCSLRVTGTVVVVFVS